MPTQTNASVSNTSHTPGPWQFIDGGEYFEIHHQDLQAEPGALALVCWADEEDKATEALANARLIANAPRLLKAAKDLWHADAAEGSDRNGMRIVDAWAELIDTIETADGTRPLDPDEPTVEDLRERFA